MRKDQTPALSEFFFSLAAAMTQLGEAIENGDLAIGAAPADLPDEPEEKPAAKSSTRSRGKAKDPEPEPEEKPAAKSSTRSRGKAKPEPEPEPEPEDGDDPITLEDLQELASTLLEAGKRKVLKGILDEFGIKALTSAEEDQFDDLYDALYDAVEALG